MVMPGDNVEMTVEMIQPIAMDEGLRFAIREGGRTVGSGWLRASSSRRRTTEDSTGRAATGPPPKLSQMATLTQNKIRIRLKAYDHSAIETAPRRSSARPCARARRSPGRSRCPPRRTSTASIRRPFKDKDSREHFEIRTHKRLIDILQPTPRPSTRCSASITCPPAGHPDPIDLSPMSKRSNQARGRIPRRGDRDGGLLGRKLGMTQVFDAEDGHVERVTVLEAGPASSPRYGGPTATATTRCSSPSGPRARRSSRSRGLGTCARRAWGRLGTSASSERTPPRSPARASAGARARAQGRRGLRTGQTVKVAGVSKGKGFQGTIKRHNFHRGPVTHGSHNVRAPGRSASADPARVFKGIRGPGQMGNKRVTQRGLEVVDVRADENLLLVRGSVPGPRGSVVEIRDDG